MLHGCTPTHYSMDPGSESTLQKKVANFLYKTLTNLKQNIYQAQKLIWQWFC